jgi:serine/threonine protein kinase
LGRGSFGKVYLVRFKDSPDQNCYALKVLSKKMLKENKLLSYANIEKNIMKSLDHPFIVKLHRTF